MGSHASRAAAAETRDQTARVDSTHAELSDDVRWLRERLDEVDPGATRQDMHRLRALASGWADGGDAPGALASVTPDDAHALLKRLTIAFHLRNKAEQVHIARVNRRRERLATIDHPRAESLSEAVGALAARGLTQADLLDALAHLDIRPTLTAHPTESRRRSVMQKQGRVGNLLEARHADDLTPAERARIDSEVRQALSLLLATDEVRARRLDVIDEVRNGVRYLSGAIWDAVPTLHRDLAGAINAHYPGSGVAGPADLPTMLRYRTWIGGDRDGNPNVTAEMTAQAMESMRSAAAARHAEALERLRTDLSISDLRVPVSDALRASIERDEQERQLGTDARRHLSREAFRVKIMHMQARMGEPEYTAERYRADLELLRTALHEAGLHEVADRGPIADALVRARVFGMHLAALDIRQHSEVHGAGVAELLRLSGVEKDYTSLSEPDRCALLERELRTDRPLLGRAADVSASTREILDTLGVVEAAIRTEPESIGSYVVSMAHEASDLLEVIVLLREAGLWGIRDGVVRCPIDIAPLFETVDDLDTACDVLRSLFSMPSYGAHLRARDRFQEVMLGYSDSNKDGGFWAASWRLQRAQGEIARACASAGVSLRFFHGRGGTVARGGGRAHRAILSSPRASRNGRIRFTEQGEVISFRYDMPAIARRHLEQIVNAMLLASAPDPGACDEEPALNDAMPALMDALANESRRAYRALIDDPEFWAWFVAASPVLHIGELPIASRPVSRAGSDVRFENLRAIPWVFAWTQMRYNAPGWYGMGTAFESLVLHDPEAMDRCRDEYARGRAFRAFIDNAQQEMARARLPVARWYAQGVPGGQAFHERLRDEFARAECAVLAITGQDALLDNNPVIQHSIRERNADTDAINALQVELLRRWREAGSDEDRQALRPLILLSVNALAAAMQSTG